MSLSADTQPKSQGGWSEEILTVENATVVPPASSDFIQPGGVLDRNGDYVAHGALWRRHRPITTAPSPPSGEVAHLPGRWLWGGLLWGNFGHFLAESTARLWALDHLDAPVDGVLFMPRRTRNEARLKPFHQPFFDLLGMTEPVRVTTEPVRVDQLVVPGQGFGLGEISAGTAKARASRLARIGADVAPEGGEKLYISRTALGAAKGSILGEERVETWMAAEGYEIFHPQQHAMAEQVARYKAARKIVATDGSALHLVAMTGRQDQDIAIIARRKSSAVDLLARHVAHFCGRAPHVLLSLDATWFPAGARRVKRLAMSELNLPEIGAELARHGFISAPDLWQRMPDADIARALAATGREWEMPNWQKRQREERRGAGGAPKPAD